jgi:hypothetical protein
MSTTIPIPTCSTLTTSTDRATVDVTEAKTPRELTRDTLPVLDGTTIDTLFEGKKSIDHKQVRSVLDGYDMRGR